MSPDQLDIKITTLTSGRYCARWEWEHTDEAGELHSNHGLHEADRGDPVGVVVDEVMARVAAQLDEAGL